MHTDVHDRALLYYRILRVGIAEAQRVVGAVKAPVNSFLEDHDAARIRTLDEFNTLCVMYGQPAETFVSLMAPYNVLGKCVGGCVAVQRSGECMCGAFQPTQRRERGARVLSLFLRFSLFLDSFALRLVAFRRSLSACPCVCALFCALASLFRPHTLAQFVSTRSMLSRVQSLLL